MKKDQRDRWRKQGLCTRCGSERDRKDRVNCFACRFKGTVWTGTIKQQRIAAGLCYVCGGERECERKACAKCRARQAEIDRQRVDRYRPSQLRTGSAVLPIVEAANDYVSAARMMDNVNTEANVQLVARKTASVAIKRLFQAVDHYREVKAVLGTTA